MGLKKYRPGQKKCPRCGKFNTLWIKEKWAPNDRNSEKHMYCTKCNYNTYWTSPRMRQDKKSQDKKSKYTAGKPFKTKQGNTASYVYRFKKKFGMIVKFN